ncbi:MAG: hypothetical protein EA401_12990 [Planctomycetota bacterium]|nr:MAG: hypothetical protein EA401_12990 [Planctomycetota bacterium]
MGADAIHHNRHRACMVAFRKDGLRSENAFQAFGVAAVFAVKMGMSMVAVTLGAPRVPSNAIFTHNHVNEILLGQPLAHSVDRNAINMRHHVVDMLMTDGPLCREECRTDINARLGHASRHMCD